MLDEYYKNFLWIDAVILSSVIISGGVAETLSVSLWYMIALWSLVVCPIPLVMAAKWHIRYTGRKLGLDYLKTKVFFQSVFGSVGALLVVMAAVNLGKLMTS